MYYLLSPGGQGIEPREEVRGKTFRYAGDAQSLREGLGNCGSRNAVNGAF